MLTDTDLAYLREVDARERAATPGTWCITGAFMQFVDSAPESKDPRTIVAETWNRNALMEPTAQGKADMAFIASARTDIPRLREIIDRLAGEQVHAYWTHKDNGKSCRRIGDYEEWYECSGCFEDTDRASKYCPNCGATMGGERRKEPDDG